MKKIFWNILRWCAKKYVAKKRPYIIGVTWSIGKTTCRMILTHVLQKTLPELNISTSPKNFNTDIWLALSVLQITSFEPTFFWSMRTLILALYRCVFPKHVDVLVLEYWIDGPWDMQVLLDIALPDSAIFTWLDKVHSTHFETVDDILEEKVKLLIAAKDVVCIPSQSQVLSRHMHLIKADILTYWLKQNSESDIWFTWYDVFQDAWWRLLSRFHIHQWQEWISLIETTEIWEISAWYLSLWIEFWMIVARRLWQEFFPIDFFEWENQPWRLSLFTWIEWSVLIDSTYNAAPRSMRSAIEQVIQLRNSIFQEHQFVYCLGDMNELWEFSEEEHRKLASQISQSAEALFLLGEQTHTYTYDELKKIWFTIWRVFLCDDAHHVWRALQEYLISCPNTCLVLFKASQWWLFMEEALPYVLENQNDCSQLCRQSVRWKRKKKSELKIKN